MSLSPTFQVEQEITELLIDQVTNPTPVDVQFGEVAEILEQLRIGEAQDVSVEDVDSVMILYYVHFQSVRFKV